MWGSKLLNCHIKKEVNISEGAGKFKSQCIMLRTKYIQVSKFLDWLKKLFNKIFII